MSTFKIYIPKLFLKTFYEKIKNLPIFSNFNKVFLKMNA